MVIYDKADIVFQEIPNEVSLAFTLKGCPNMCEGCHSPHLREKTGNELTEDNMLEYIKKYKSSITTMLFLGGDAYHDDILPLIKLIKLHGLKTAIYSGLNSFTIELLDYLDYYKVGNYNEKYGGLNSKTTNQKLFKINGLEMEDITYKFWKDGE